MSERSPDTSHRQGSKHRRREPLCARNTRFRAIPNAQTSPEHSSSTAICNHCLANHTTASTNGSNPQQRSGPLSARVNIYFLTSDHQPLIVIGHVPIFFWDHIQVRRSLHGDTKPWRSRLFLSRYYLKSSALPKELYVIWMASCVPLCSHVFKIFLNVKTLPRLHYLLPQPARRPRTGPGKIYHKYELYIINIYHNIYISLSLSLS